MINQKTVLSVSFSGGRTSAYMTKILKDRYSDKFDIKPLFANTGQEHEETYNFIKNCDDAWGFNTIWLEAVVNPEKGEGTRHKIVDYYSASRNGAPYRDVCAKYGLSNPTWQPCTREMKTSTMNSYRSSTGLDKDNSYVAIGIRIDEPRRVKSGDRDKYNIIYPLVDWFPTTKPEILTWFMSQPFDLGIPDYLGNCVWCFKKSTNKLIRAYKDNPSYFDFPLEMESLHSFVGPEDDAQKPRKIYRKHRTVSDIIKLATDNQEYIKNIEQIASEDATQNECSESCEPFQMEILL